MSDAYKQFSYLREESKIKQFNIVGFLAKPATSEKLLDLLHLTYKPLPQYIDWGSHPYRVYSNRSYDRKYD